MQKDPAVVKPLFIATYPDGALRINLPTTDANRDIFYRRDRRYWDTNSSTRTSHDYRLELRALLFISNQDCVFQNGVLTPWSPWTRRLLEYYGKPLDAYEVLVHEAHPFSKPVFLDLCEDKKHVSTGGLC